MAWMRSGLAAVLAMGVASAALAQEARAPINVPEGPGFSAAKIPAYKGKHDAVYKHIDANQTQHLENLKRWVRQRSISAQNDGIAEMAALVAADLKALGFQEAEVVPTSGHPGVWGYYDAGARKTLVIYMMYDVQPIEPVGWQVDAFAGEIVENQHGKVLMARGATNQKGPERAFLNAVSSIIAVNKKLPVNLMVLAEGEEELGSLHYPELIAKFQDRMKTADGVLFPFNSQSPAGTVTMPMGVKGIVYFELEAKGGPWGGPKGAEVHGSNKIILDSPPWRLAQALATLTTPDGNTITVPGYYDPIRTPNAEEVRLFNGQIGSWEAGMPATLKALDADKLIGDWTPRQSLAVQLFDTQLNIDGITSGYGGPGMKTILPHKAVAKLDSRLVPNQTPDEALDMIRKHLVAKGFNDIEVRKLSGYKPAQTSVDAPLVQAALGVYRKHGITPGVVPRLAGSAPYYVFTDTLGLPLVTGGMGHGSAQHAPNEYMVIEPAPGSKVAGLAEVEKFYVDLLYALAASK